MRFQKHLNEAGISEIPNEFWRRVRKHCGSFLKEWMPIVKKKDALDVFLYRGMTQGGDTGHKKVRKNRKPESSGQKFHRDIDNMMKQMHGINGRTKSVFCTGDASATVSYGESYIIFPVGRYKYIWSPKIRDLYVDARRQGYNPNMMEFIQTTAHKMKLDIYDEKKGGEIRRELRKMGEAQNTEAIRKIVKQYKTTDLMGAIMSGNEIMIECDSYLWIRGNWTMEFADIVNDWA